MLRVVAICEIPVVSSLGIVPVRVPVIVNVIATVVFLANLSINCINENERGEGATESEFI